VFSRQHADHPGYGGGQIKLVNSLNMYYIAKIAQATGLTVILVGFLKDFPRLMNPGIFGTGAVIFMLGWIVERFMLKRQGR